MINKTFTETRFCLMVMKDIRLERTIHGLGDEQASLLTQNLEGLEKELYTALLSQTREQKAVCLDIRREGGKCPSCKHYSEENYSRFKALRKIPSVSSDTTLFDPFEGE